MRRFGSDAATSRSTSVVLPVPDGRRDDEQQAAPVGVEPGLLDILHLLAHLLELGLAAMISSDTRRPSAFEPIVLTSRFISCSRKSSLRPHGSVASVQRLQCARCAAEPRRPPR